MIFLAVAGLLYVLATLRRESRIPDLGDLHDDAMALVLTYTAVCVSIGAVAAAALFMVLQV